MKGFLDYFEELSRNVPEDEQEIAVNRLIELCKRDPSSLSLVIQTTAAKKKWYNEAKVVCAQEDKVLERYAQRLLEWLRDINCPGAGLIFDRLVVMRGPAIEQYIQDAMRWAIQEGWDSVLNELIAEREKYATVGRMKDFYDYLDDLSWDAPEEAQGIAVTYLVEACRQKPSLLSLVIQTTTEKKKWDNEAKVVCAQEDGVLERYTQRLLEWLRDLNWPGADLIFDRLVMMKSTVLDQHIRDEMQWAIQEGWMPVLNDLIAERKKYAKVEKGEGPHSDG